jgi:hypothetical protein
MVDVVPTPETPIVGAKAVSQNGEAGEQAGSKEVDVGALIEKLSKLEKRLDDQSKLIYKSGKKTEEPAPAKPAKSAEEMSLREQIAELKVEQAKSKEQAARAKRASARNDLIGEFISAGVSPDDAADQAELILLRQGNRIDQDDELGQSIYRSSNPDSGEEDVIPLRDWVRSIYLQSERGKKLIPAKKQPTTSGIPKSSQTMGPSPDLPPGHYYYSMEDGAAGKVSLEDIKSGKAHIRAR